MRIEKMNIVHIHIILQEDEMVVKLVEKYGPKRWSLIASQLKGRIGKQCRERYALSCFFNAS